MKAIAKATLTIVLLASLVAAVSAESIIVFIAGLGLCALGHKAVKGYHLIRIVLIGVKLKALMTEIGI